MAGSWFIVIHKIDALAALKEAATERFGAKLDALNAQPAAVNRGVKRKRPPCSGRRLDSLPGITACRSAAGLGGGRHHAPIPHASRKAIT